jgi:glutamate-ammonia-ligase adenylyltransferase
MTRPSLATHSRFAQRVRRRYETELPLLAPGVPDPAQLLATFDALQTQGHNLPSALRITRQLVVERLLCLDCEQQLPLAQVTQAMTDLAEFTLNRALTQAQATLDQSHGEPRTASGQRAQVWVG